VESGGGGAFLSFHRALSFFKQGGVRWWWSFFELSQSFELFIQTRWSPVVVELFEKLFTSFELFNQTRWSLVVEELFYSRFS
jgi:hypothetical protein